MELTERQMYEVNGGISWGIVAGIAAAIVYIVGCLSGYTNPNRCNN
ncbi:MAG: class IIb bacteriocin, lactobin A/cerein 7B family [Bacilli bacterium]|nr:class IIb bacteriocin, lactobin A/cerein 7B family [Bacilli bacterium]